MTDQARELLGGIIWRAIKEFETRTDLEAEDDHADRYIDLILQHFEPKRERLKVKVSGIQIGRKNIYSIYVAPPFDSKEEALSWCEKYDLEVVE